MKDVIIRSVLKALLIISFFLLAAILFNESRYLIYDAQWHRELKEAQKRGYSTVTRGGYVNHDTIKMKR